MRQPSLYIIYFLAGGIVFIPNVYAQSPNTTPSFKYTTNVFIGDAKTPSSTNHTVFKDGLIFDFRFSNESASDRIEEVVIYEPRKRNFILLDYSKKVRLDMDSFQIIRIVDGMKSELERDERLQKLYLNGYTVENHVEDNFTSVKNDFIRYSARGKRPADETIIPTFIQYLEQFTRIRVSDPKSMPPFPRMMLNGEIKKIGFVPEEIRLQMLPNELNKTGFKANSSHHLEMSLDESDLERIRNAKRNWMNFRRIELAEYRKIEVADSLPQAKVKR